MTKNCLLTGAAGFIGRHMQPALEDAGYLVLPIDLKKGTECRRFFAKDDHHFDLVVHLAAIVGGRETIQGQPMAVAVDLAIDADMFQWALRTKPGRVVYFSSAAAYGDIYQEDAGLQLCEDLIRFDGFAGVPDMTYGWAKLTGEVQAGYVEAEGVPVNVFRPFSGYASDQDADWYPFPAFIDRALRFADPFEVWGTGEQSRDFIHVDDIIATVLAAVDQGYDEGPVNLCTGRATTLNGLAELCAAEVGYEPEILNRGEKPVGPMHRVGNPEKMNRLRPARITLEEGIKRAVTER